MSKDDHIIRLEIPSQFDMLDLVQSLSENMGQVAHLNEDSTHWVGVAVRESVINAIKHGNRNDPTKRVIVEFKLEQFTEPHKLVVRVLDEGIGFDLDDVGDPLAQENCLKSNGRGVFFIRSFMDTLTVERIPSGGTEVRMTKTLS